MHSHALANCIIAVVSQPKYDTEVANSELNNLSEATLLTRIKWVPLQGAKVVVRGKNVCYMIWDVFLSWRLSMHSMK